MINIEGTCFGQHQRQAQAPQSLPATPRLCLTRASRQVSLPLSHSHCHFPYTTYQPLIQPKTPCPVCCTAPWSMLHLMMCFSVWQYPSTAKPSGKCLSVLGNSAKSWYSSKQRVWSCLCSSQLLQLFCIAFGMAQKISAFSHHLPAQLHLGKWKISIVTTLYLQTDIYFPLFHHRTR